MVVEAIVVECPKCGRKMPSYRDICFKCSGVEVRDAQEFVDEAKKFAPEKKQVVPQSVLDERHAAQEYIAYYYPEHYTNHLPTNDWYMNASYKMHDTRYRDKDPFAYKSCGALTAMMTGCTLEDVARWYDAPITGKYDGWHNDIITRECAAINRAYAQSLEGEDTWFRLHRLIEEDKLDIADDYSIKLALKKSRVMVPYIVDTIVPPIEGIFDGIKYNTLRTLIQYECPTKMDINSLAMTPDEARGRNGTKNYARRITIFIPELDVTVKVTNIGTNPYTHEQVRVPSRRINYNTTFVDGRQVDNALEPLREFYGQFQMNKHNYCGTVNKKSDGRDPRTGSYPDPKSEDMLQLYRHQPAIIISPNIKIQETQHIVKFKQVGALQQDKELAKVSRGEDCECGCNVKVKDMRRGEVICPQCGLVFHRDTIVG